MHFRTTELLLLGAMALPASATARNHPCCTGNYTNSGRRNQTADRHRRTAPFQSGERHSSAGREERRLRGQRHPLPDVGIDRGRARWRSQNAQQRRGVVRRRRKDRGADGGQRRAIDFPPLLPCPGSGLGSACRDGTCRCERAISQLTPILDLKPGGYDLNLTRVTFPAQMPSNQPHHRSGAALYFIISGTGANTVEGKTEARGPGSLIYEPYALVHQWGNPGNEPLIFLAFNINPEGVAAVLPGAPAKNQ